MQRGLIDYRAGYQRLAIGVKLDGELSSRSFSGLGSCQRFHWLGEFEVNG